MTNSKFNHQCWENVNHNTRNKNPYFTDVWFQFRDFSYIGSQKHIAVSGLDLQPGLKYRFSMKFCAHSICFPTISSDGVTVVPSYPIIDSIEVHLEDQKVVFKNFKLVFN